MCNFPNWRDWPPADWSISPRSGVQLVYTTQAHAHKQLVTEHLHLFSPVASYAVLAGEQVKFAVSSAQ